MRGVCCSHGWTALLIGQNPPPSYFSLFILKVHLNGRVNMISFVFIFHLMCYCCIVTWFNFINLFVYPDANLIYLFKEGAGSKCCAYNLHFFMLLHNHSHGSSATVTSATWGLLQSHVPHFHPQQWSHMFVKMCMLCAFSSPICSYAFSPMSPVLPGGQNRSLTLFIQTEQLGPSQPKKSWGEKLSWRVQVKPSGG